MPSRSRRFAFILLFPLLASGFTADGSPADEVPPSTKKPGRLDEAAQKELESLWADLASLNDTVAYRALRKLIDMPTKAVVPFLKERLQPAPKADPEQIKRLLTQFISDDPAAQQVAGEELKRLGWTADNAVGKALARHSDTPEPARKRLKDLSVVLRHVYLNPEVKRGVGAVTVLGAIGSAEAQQILETLATGEPSANLTGAAETALKRLNPLWFPAPRPETAKKPPPPRAAPAQAIPEDEEQEKEPRTLPAHKKGVTAIVFSRDSKALASVSVAGDLSLWDVVKGQQLWHVKAHEGGVYALALSSDGKILASAGADRLIGLWDPATGRKLGALQGHKDKVATVVFSSDGKTLASGGYDGAICLWDTATGVQLRHAQVLKGRVTSLAFAPNGKTLVSGGTTNTVLLPGGNLISTGYADHLRLWDVATGTEVRQLQWRGSTVVFSADGSQLASGGLVPDIQQTGRGTSIDGFDLICLLDPATGEDRRTIKWRGQTVGFSGDGKLLMTGQGTALHLADFGILAYNGVNGTNADGRLRLWEIASGQEILKLSEKQATAVALSPDGQVLAAGRWDGAILLWDLAQQVKTPAKKADAEQLWSQLAADAVAAYRASWALSASPREAVALLKGRLRPVSEADAKQVLRLIAELDASQFALREAAFRQLQKLGTKAELALRHALTNNPSLEVRAQINTLLNSLKEAKLSLEELQTSRAIRILEQIGSPMARQVLETLAQGSILGQTTVDARAALQRLDRR